MYSASDPTSGSELPDTTECSRIDRVSSRGSWPNQGARDRARFVPEVPQKGGNRRPGARSLSSFVFLDTTGFRVCSSLPVARPTADLSQPGCEHPRWACQPPPVAQGSEASPAARNTLDSARIPRASKLLICGLFQKGRVLAQDWVADGAVWSYPVSIGNPEKQRINREYRHKPDLRRAFGLE